MMLVEDAIKIEGLQTDMRTENANSRVASRLKKVIDHSAMYIVTEDVTGYYYPTQLKSSHLR